MWQDKSISNQFRPAILQTFGDIAQAIGPHFETYLSVVGQVLQAAANVTSNENSAMELIEYIISLREGIMDAWSGAILAMKTKGRFEIVGVNHLINKDDSNIIGALRRAYVCYVASYCSRPKSKRGSSAIDHGCHWVRTIEPRDMSSQTADMNTVTSPIHFPVANILSSFARTG